MISSLSLSEFTDALVSDAIFSLSLATALLSSVSNSSLSVFATGSFRFDALSLRLFWSVSTSSDAILSSLVKTFFSSTATS